MIRKVVAVCLLSLVLADLAAVSPSQFPSADSMMISSYNPTSARTSAMGGAGLAVNGTYGARFLNPANAAGVFGLSVPSLSFTAYNLRSNIPVVKDVVSSTDEAGILDAAVGFINNIPGGVKDFMSLDAGVGLAMKFFSFSVDANADIFTFGPGDISSNIGVDINLALTSIFSYRHEFSDDLAFSVGLGVRAMYKNLTADDVYLAGIGATTVSDVFNKSEDLQGAGNAILEALSDIPLSVGWAFPVSIGTKLEVPYGFSFALALNNINGDYAMSVFQEDGSVRSYVLETPMTLDIGASWSWGNEGMWKYLFKPTIALDFVDIVGFFRNGPLERGAFVDHLRMGAEVYLLTSLIARAGLDRGYFTCGFGLDIFAVTLDLTYGLKAYGPSRYGECLDYLTVRVNIGLDR